MESVLDIYDWQCYIGDGKFAFHFKCGVNAVKNRIEDMRKERGLTQEELADRLEVSRQTIGSLENGRYNPSILLAFKIAVFFSASIEDIFIYEGDEPYEK